MNRFNLTHRIMGAASLTIVAATAALAQNALAPGGSASLTGASAVSWPDETGSVIADVMRPFSTSLNGNVVVSGQLQDRVTRSTNTGTLVFEHRILNDANSIASIRMDERGSLAGYANTVDYLTDGSGTVDPVNASRSSDGAAVAFDFQHDVAGLGYVHPGESSQFMEVLTDATNYNDQGSDVLLLGGDFRSLPVTLNTFQPTAPVPEPGTLPMVAMAAFPLMGLARKRRV